MCVTRERAAGTEAHHPHSKICALPQRVFLSGAFQEWSTHVPWVSIPLIIRARPPKFFVNDVTGPFPLCALLSRALGPYSSYLSDHPDR
ncbi:hypothetical protein DAD186_05020 [Dermabacter vaginalis]|uniref:Uncharacterized protein n=1 Tax=Dermabacter vaginalis TaxID=1630135 RepID=A0A1B0ZGK8_9MICO|nr:hypothetical protein DAD186_05020 [Dermabacter vaginalis]